MYIYYMNERNWGGKRKGAGRKKGVSIIYKTFSVSLPKDEYKVLKDAAERKRMTISRFTSKYLSLDVMAEINKENKS